jgi:hypothetical protein
MSIDKKRFHATSDKRGIVQYHPQADSERARSSGYVVLRLEEWIVLKDPGFADWLADRMNGEAAKAEQHAPGEVCEGRR